jgi:hypothetical protein
MNKAERVKAWDWENRIAVQEWDERYARLFAREEAEAEAAEERQAAQEEVWAVEMTEQAHREACEG